ncbi:MAG: FHA domain-containing protein [Acidobacteria bacterium]|jgi:hypothetical protein|nr:FHA domain-containing protein [Acidobacteriota bacterium]
MKKDQLPAPSILGRACAGFSFAGLWQETKVPLLLALLALAAVLAMLLWLARRRRRDDFPEIQPGTPSSRPDLGMTQVEDAESGVERKPSPSPGIHGKIEVLVGGQQISSYLVTDNPLPIGRDPGQALVIIQEPIVSKLHCQVYAQGGQVFVKDLNSTNGIYVNDVKISERQLQDGDAIFLGKKGTVRVIYRR